MSDQPIGDKAPSQPYANDPPASGIRTSDTTTEGIRIQVKSLYLADRSSPREGQFYFAYSIRITNVGLETAQLLTRHWIITDAEGEVQEVRGEGVVGKQPVLEPSMSFEYTSYCPLKTNVGSMHGSYTLARPDGRLLRLRCTAAEQQADESCTANHVDLLC